MIKFEDDGICFSTKKKPKKKTFSTILNDTMFLSKSLGRL